jgi:hypothetical protein
MDREYKKEIEEVIGQFKCPKDFGCYKSGFDVLCKAKDIGVESFLLCLERRSHGCKFLSVKRGYACECPLRFYVARNLKK